MHVLKVPKFHMVAHLCQMFGLIVDICLKFYLTLKVTLSHCHGLRIIKDS